MKRSEFKDKVKQQSAKPGGVLVLPHGLAMSNLFKALPNPYNDEHLAEYLAKFEEEQNGTIWDPEEPELPYRLAIEPSAARNKNAVLIAPDHANLALDIEPGHPWWRLIEAAFAAYNASRMGTPEPEPDPEDLVTVVQEERREEPRQNGFAWSAWKVADEEEWAFNRILAAVEVLSNSSISSAKRVHRALCILTGKES